jgi:hypothetical protein
MKKLLVVTLIVSGATCLLAQQPASTPSEKRKYLERFFSNGRDPQPDFRNVSPKPSAAPTGSRTETWELFPAEKLPVGKAVNEADAETLSTGNYLGQNLYLAGTFDVTVDGPQKAVLRFVNARSPIRIIAEYPPETAAPTRGTKLTLNQSHGMLIRNVTRAASDRTLLLFVRDIKRP